jgi:hypothetical protein
MLQKNVHLAASENDVFAKLSEYKVRNLFHYAQNTNICHQFFING